MHLAFAKPARLGPDGFESLLVSLDENSQEVRGWLGCCLLLLPFLCSIYILSIILIYSLNECCKSISTTSIAAALTLRFEGLTPWTAQRHEWQPGVWSKSTTPGATVPWQKFRNLAAFVHIGKTLGKLRNFLSWVIDGRHLPALNPLIVGLETTSRRGLLCTGPIHQFTGLRCLSSHWSSSGACEVEVWKWSYWKRLKDQVHFRLLSLLFRS